MKQALCVLAGILVIGVVAVSHVQAENVVFYEPFEGSIDPGWTVSTGSATYTGNSYAGSQALDISDMVKILYHPISPYITKGYAECWIYDNASDIQGDLEFTTIAAPRLAIRTNDSTTNYVVWTESASAIVTSVVRTTGWHKFRWEIDGGILKGYIDGIEVYSTTLEYIATVGIRNDGFANPELANGAVDELKVVDLLTPTPTSTPVATNTVTPTSTPTLVPPSLTFTPTFTEAYTLTLTPSGDAFAPSFRVIAIYDPDATDIIKIKIISSEPLKNDKLDKVEVVPQSSSHPKSDITASIVYQGNNVFIGEYPRSQGFGDIEYIYVTGTDINDNQGISDGSYEKQVKPSKQAVVIRNNVIDPTTGGEATVHVELDHLTKVKVSIYDRKRRLVKIIVDEMKSISFEAAWNGVNSSGSVVSSGIYIVTVETDTFTETKKVIVKK